MLPFPPSSTDPTYEAVILDAVARGDYEHYWAPVTSSIPATSSEPAHTGTFYMSADALKIDGFRPGVGAGTMQKVADLIGAIFPTIKLRDLQWLQRTTYVPPVLIWSFTNPLTGQPFTTNDMELVSTMRFISSQIDKQAAAAGWVPPKDSAGSAILQDVGKPWALSNTLLNHPGKAMNVGWAFPGTTFGGQSWEVSPATPGLHEIQGPGWAHGLTQADYSQVMVFAYRWCNVDGQVRDIADIYRDPVLSKLVSHEGPLELVRQPGVPCQACAVAATTPMPLAARLASAVDTSGTTICPPPADSSLPPGSTPSSSGSRGGSGGGLISTATTSDVLKGLAIGAAAVGAGALAYWGWQRYQKRGRLF